MRAGFVSHGSTQMDTGDLIKKEERESRKGISEIEGKAARVATSEGGSQTSFKPLHNFFS